MIHIAYFESPIGMIEIQATERAVTSIVFADEVIHVQQTEDHPILLQAIAELKQYFTGNRKQFTLPLEPQGTDFQKRVWERVAEVPYAETRSYRDIATQAGNEKAVRAIGNANSKNKILIVIPCHRVVASNQQLTGYAGGLWRKEWLLKHETNSNFTASN